MGSCPENLAFEPVNQLDALMEGFWRKNWKPFVFPIYRWEMDQTAAAEAMGISRGTFRILVVAHHKVADALVNGGAIPS